MGEQGEPEGLGAAADRHRMRGAAGFGQSMLECVDGVAGAGCSR